MNRRTKPKRARWIIAACVVGVGIWAWLSFSAYTFRDQLHVLLTLSAAVPAHAAEDIQQIILGPHTFYVPKAWMQDRSFTAYPAPRGMIDRPQPVPIEAVRVSIRPKITAGQWGSFARRELPEFIRIVYIGDRLRPDPILEHRRKWLDQVANAEVDSNGFVRVATGPTKPGQRPEWERFVYKGYQNALGDPLVIDSINTAYPSTVSISLTQDMNVLYRFDNKKFPERTWWDLYQRVLAFLGYLQTAK